MSSDSKRSLGFLNHQGDSPPPITPIVWPTLSEMICGVTNGWWLQVCILSTAGCWMVQSCQVWVQAWCAWCVMLRTWWMISTWCLLLVCFYFHLQWCLNVVCLYILLFPFPICCVYFPYSLDIARVAPQFITAMRWDPFMLLTYITCSYLIISQVLWNIQSITATTELSCCLTQVWADGPYQDSVSQPKIKSTVCSPANPKSIPDSSSRSVGKGHTTVMLVGIILLFL